MEVQEYKKMTNLQLLLDYLSPEQSVKDDAILEYFSDQDNYEFCVGNIDYVLLTERDVKSILREEAKEECLEFLSDAKKSMPFYRDIISTFEDNIYDLTDYLMVDKNENDVKKYEYIEELSGNLYLFSE